MNQSALLFIFGAQAIQIRDGEAPYTTLSENTHNFIIAHEALRMGHRVFFKMVDFKECLELTQVYPIVKIARVIDFYDPTFEPAIIFAVNYGGILSADRPHKPSAIGVLILNAHYWLENAAGFDLNIIDQWRLALVKDVDFILTQNPRMAELGFSLFNLTAKWEWQDRILLAPNTYTPETLARENNLYDRAKVRAEMGLQEDDIAIINSGGPWIWTDYLSFLHAFIFAVRSGATRLRHIQMGIRQPTNRVHEQMEGQYRILMMQNHDLIESGHWMVMDDWQQASACLPAWNYGADIGLNVSKETAENYQSHRVRFLDYAKAGLPILQTTGSYYGDHDARDAIIPVQSGNKDSYVDALMRLNNGEIDLPSKRRAMENFRNSISSEKLVPEAIKTMLTMGKLPDDLRYSYQVLMYAHYRNYELDNFIRNFKLRSEEDIQKIDDYMMEQRRILEAMKEEDRAKQVS